MSTLRDGSLCICLPKATALHQETPAVCENHLVSSHQFAEHLKRCCTQVRKTYEHRQMNKTGQERLQAVERALFQSISGQMRGGVDGSPFVA